MNKPAVAFLLPLWGKKFIEKFFHFSLPTLLAPGNIPSLSEDFNASFLFLTQKSEKEFIQAQPAMKHLMNYCHIEFVDISDLIFIDQSGIHNVSVALAYERGMRSRHEKICQTYFFFLTSDILAANDAFHNMKRYLQEGYSGITIGGLRVTEESILPALKQFFSLQPFSTLSLSAREFLSLAFQCLHPLTQAESVTHEKTHIAYPNRLFWKADAHTIIGRFYTRHMMCIKPEIDHYVIGAPCDYCFIPELCPSGNIMDIQDSDDVCIIEMSPTDHDKHYIRSGPFHQETIAKELSELTTIFHRRNAQIPVLFHCETITESAHAMIRESRDFVDTIEQNLSTIAQPLRGHPFWVKGLEVILYYILQHPQKTPFYCKEDGTVAGIIGSPSYAPILGGRLDDSPLLKMTNPSTKLPERKKAKRNLRKFFLGNSPYTSLWHLCWLDDALIKRAIQKKLKSATSSLLIAFESIPDIMDWLDKSYPEQLTYQLYDFFVLRQPQQLHSLIHNKEEIIILFTEDDFAKINQTLKICKPYLSAKSHITIFLKHKRAVFKKELKQNIDSLIDQMNQLELACETMQWNYNFPLLHFRRASDRYATKLFHPGKSFLTRLNGAFGLSMIFMGCILGNFCSLLGINSKKKSTSTLLQFIPKNTQTT